ncbi:hypothetical protein [Haloarcula sp. 1CSR25-25]|uniref:hypothetical protein n=1 Tax=Haloarcula sp. 1CSR25-25 TaxID=2862545 RepID=UPI0028954D22|nr:hypothetical protein [Haloarcula sp. 1CSR25-25]MDT3435963.1 hypothetical protein [Haloarcula sp. 1CSR25-25]
MTSSLGSHTDFTPQHRTIGRAAAWSVFVLGVVYALVTALGFLSLESPQDPIGDPYITIMRLLIIPLAALYVVTMVTVHAYARPAVTVYSQIALVFMIVLATITTSVHFVGLTVGPRLEATGLSWVPLVVSFEWPSIVYALDILAWDWFFALSILFAVPVFRGGSRLERWVWILLLVSGVLSLAGMIGVPFSDMQVRNIGIIGYAVIAPVAFLLMGIVFGRTQPVREDSERRPDSQSAA